MRDYKGVARRRRFARQKGQVLIELALCGVIYALLIVGTLELSRVMLRYHQLTQIAREGARIASTTAGINDPGNSSAQGLVLSRMDQILTKMNLINSLRPTISVNPVTVTSVDGIETKLVEVTLSQLIGNILGGASLIPGLSGQTISVTIAMPQFV